MLEDGMDKHTVIFSVTEERSAAALQLLAWKSD
jgi:hypothetical protein